MSQQPFIAMSQMWRITLTVLFAFSFAACDLLDVRSGDVEGPLIRTSDSTFAVQRTEDALEVAIPLTFYNGAGETVYINQCHSPAPPVLQKKTEEGWKDVYSSVRLDCLGSPIVIEEGEEYEYIFEMDAPLRENAAPRFGAEEVAGTYRLKWELHTEYEEGDPAYDLLPLEKRISNPFKLREQ